ncbi:CubicO group peptidase, beta-lactamase class C family [Salinibacillus kushneri]|uniref:CubicO group peptidase, beta-lactamase class C family n=1 Tax=Salinibacillus kushneri TaxID=237682 RepID=A0A1I0EXJ2_9BACI|nr:serine hydrolase domain-containing protein [Salinibacillus kushneri]SET50195.1 CubicO group peptidase, beta-lactamase class C family [Salinibacillus kushneri]
MRLNNINIEERMNHYHVPGLSITLINNGQVSRTENYGLLEAKSNQEVKEHSIFNACSISKFLTGMLVMKLSDEGVLHLDEDVNKTLKTWKIPESNFTKDKKVTLRSLLSHQSGIKDPDNSFSELHLDSEVPSMVDLLEGKTPFCKQPIEVKYEPDSEFHYSDAGFCIIQLLIEDVTNRPFHQVMNECVFEPLEMKHSNLKTGMIEMERKDYACGHNRNGERVDEIHPIYPYPAASGLWTTSKDLARLVLELMNALKGETKIGISPIRAKEMITPQKGKSWTGLGVFLDGFEKEQEISSLGWGVGFQSMMVAFPYLEEGAVIMTNAELGVHQMEGIIGEIYKALIS